eukprot:GHVS01010906.1.p1 GENE.GHVS01010906.1~~GHVS01010906.1.p1  ORF type:complete len:861 (-),score=140.74 GHVS01010906.1:157-2739(-)
MDASSLQSVRTRRVRSKQNLSAAVEGNLNRREWRERTSVEGGGKLSSGGKSAKEEAETEKNREMENSAGGGDHVDVEQTSGAGMWPGDMPTVSHSFRTTVVRSSSRSKAKAASCNNCGFANDRKDVDGYTERKRGDTEDPSRKCVFFCSSNSNSSRCNDSRKSSGVDEGSKSGCDAIKGSSLVEHSSSMDKKKDISQSIDDGSDSCVKERESIRGDSDRGAGVRYSNSAVGSGHNPPEATVSTISGMTAVGNNPAKSRKTSNLSIDFDGLHIDDNLCDVPPCSFQSSRTTSTTTNLGTSSPVVGAGSIIAVSHSTGAGSFHTSNIVTTTSAVICVTTSTTIAGNCPNSTAHNTRVGTASRNDGVLSSWYYEQLRSVRAQLQETEEAHARQMEDITRRHQISAALLDRSSVARLAAISRRLAHCQSAASRLAEDYRALLEIARPHLPPTAVERMQGHIEQCLAELRRRKGSDVGRTPSAIQQDEPDDEDKEDGGKHCTEEEEEALGPLGDKTAADGQDSITAQLEEDLSAAFESYAAATCTTAPGMNDDLVKRPHSGCLEEGMKEAAAGEEGFEEGGRAQGEREDERVCDGGNRGVEIPYLRGESCEVKSEFALNLCELKLVLKAALQHTCRFCGSSVHTSHFIQHVETCVRQQSRPAVGGEAAPPPTLTSLMSWMSYFGGSPDSGTEEGRRVVTGVSEATESHEWGVEGWAGEYAEEEEEWKRKLSTLEKVEQECFLCDHLFIDVIGVEKRTEGRGRSHQEFVIRVSAGETVWQVDRRYREILALHHRLMVQFPGLNLPTDCCPSASFRRPNESEIALRQAKLQVYLKALSRIQVLRESDDFRCFLDIDKHPDFAQSFLT